MEDYSWLKQPGENLVFPTRFETGFQNSAMPDFLSKKRVTGCKMAKILAFRSRAASG